VSECNEAAPFCLRSGRSRCNADGELSPVPFDPVNNRVFVRFKDSGGVTHGSTSVAVRTP